MTVTAAGIGSTPDASPGMREPGPRENLLLRDLPADELEPIAAELECVALTPDTQSGGLQLEPGQIHFIGAGIVSITRSTQGHDPVGVAIVGREGGLGLGLLTGGSNQPQASIVIHAPVRAWRMEVASARQAYAAGGRFQRNVVRFRDALAEQIARNAVCVGRHRVEDQVRRWLLVAFDRIDEPELRVTHGHIAAVLGIRRASVSEALSRLQQAGGIEVGRGRIRVLDRLAFEATACDCCRILRDEYASLRADLARP